MRRRSFRPIVVHTFAALALLMASAPAKAGVIWQTGHETGDLSDWSRDGGGGIFNSGTGQVSVTTEAAHSGRYSAKMVVSGIDGGVQACRLFRWGEHLSSGYFSTWYMFPVLPQVNGWLNIFQFKKKNYATGQVDPTWYNEVENQKILSLTHWNQAWDIPANVQPPPTLVAGKWFHIEWYYKDGVSDGAIKIWIDGNLIWDLAGINTRGIDPDIQWAPVLYGANVTPGYLVAYVDDAAISTTRVGTGSSTPNQSPVAAMTVNPASGVSPLPVALNASGSSDPDGTIASYAWNFGDGTTGSGAAVSHTYANAGTYTATLTVTDNLGATGTATKTVTVNAPVNQAPTALLSASPTSGTAPLAVALDASGSSDPDGAIASYTWNCGDGIIHTGVAHTHTYSAAGTYTATLTVTDNQGATGTATKTITANAPAPPPPPSSGPVALWHFDEAAWTGASGEVKDASGGNNHGTAGNGAATTAGSTGRAGAFDGVDDHVTIPPNSILNISGSGLTLSAWVNFPALTGNPMGILSQGGYWNGYRYTITSTGAVSFDLTSSVSGTLVSQKTLAPGVWHHVAATYDGAAMRIYIDGVKDGNEKARTGAVDPSTGEVWIGHGDRETGQAWSYPFRGMIDEVQIYDRALSAQEVAALYGAMPPAPNQSPMAAASASPTSGTAPLTVSFSASGSSDPDGTIASYGWNFGDGGTGSGAAVSRTYSAAGTYTATLTVTDNAGASATASTTVTVTAAPASDPNRYVVDANTVALYHFDGDLKDASPNGLHLSAQGGASVVTDDSGGQVLRTRNLGDQAVASIPDWRLMPNTGTLSPLTIEARIFPRAYKAYSVGNYPIVSLAQDWDTRLGVLDRKWSAMRLPRVEGSRDVVLMDEAAWGSRVTLNAWHLLKITFETNGRASVYVDGVLVGSQTVSMNVGRSGNWVLQLGNFDGDIDEVRVSNVARTGGAAKPASADEGLPLAFSLGQNLPNPFNPSTTIRYALPEASPVRLTVYNALGQEVRVLVNEAQGPGFHSARWDGRDASGRAAAAGVYFYRLEAGPRAAVGRMVFAK